MGHKQLKLILNESFLMKKKLFTLNFYFTFPQYNFHGNEQFKNLIHFFSGTFPNLQSFRILKSISVNWVNLYLTTSLEF